MDIYRVLRCVSLQTVSNSHLLGFRCCIAHSQQEAVLPATYSSRYSNILKVILHYRAIQYYTMFCTEEGK